MKRIRACILLVGVLVVFPLARGGVEGPFLGKLERGMTPEQVRRRVGPPRHISRQILYHRYLEQWSYDAPVTARPTFDCLRGEKPQLVFP